MNFSLFAKKSVFDLGAGPDGQLHADPLRRARPTGRARAPAINADGWKTPWRVGIAAATSAPHTRLRAQPPVAQALEARAGDR